MTTMYYNKQEFKEAMSLIDTDPNKTLFKLENYLKNYPKDYSAYIYYASILITLGNFTEAQELLNYVENISNNDKDFEKNIDKVNFIKRRILFMRARIFTYQENYIKLYKICQILKYEQNMNVNEVIFYCKKKLGLLETKNREKNSYLFKQILEYSELDFLEEVKKHLPEYNRENQNSSKTIFSYDFKINDVIDEIKKYIPSENRLYPDFIDNSYYFKLDGCGTVNNKRVNYFKVLCFHNTSDIITMHPVEDKKNLPYIDLNYMIIDEKTKIKRKSQIDKFNQRYNKK